MAEINANRDPITGTSYAPGYTAQLAQQTAAQKAAQDAATTAAQQAADDARVQQLIKQTVAGRNADLASGKALGQETFGNNALGRVVPGTTATAQSILDQRQANLQGFTPQEQQAQRDNNQKAIMADQQAQARNLQRQQAQSGVRGATASAQSSAQNLATQGQMADQERQLFLNQMAAKRSALDAYQGADTANTANNLAKEQYNIGQANKETYGKLTTQLGMGSLGAQERASAMSSVLGDKQLAAAKDIAAQSGKK